MKKIKTNWNVMIYMAGDNNLSIDMAYALEELQKKIPVSDINSINLYVHYVNNSPEIPSIYCDFSNTDEPFFQYSTDIVDKYSQRHSSEEIDLHAVNPVVDFVDWCSKKENFIADSDIQNKYILIFSGHTMGFFSMGLLKDEHNEKNMTMPNLKIGLEIIKDKILGQKLSMLGFDSCVMSMLEVGQQFNSVAETMIASEGSIPNAGWTYSELLLNLTNENSDIKKIAEKYVFDYIEKQSNYTIGGVSVDMSAWDLSKVKFLTDKFEDFAKSILSCFEKEENETYQQMRQILLQAHFNSQTYMFEQNIDLGDFCKQIINEIEVNMAVSNKNVDKKLSFVVECCKELISEINNCIILSGFSGGEYQFSNGISLFFPWSYSAYCVSVNDYLELEFIQKTDAGKVWNTFLHKYLSEVSLRKSVSSTEMENFALNKSSNSGNNEIFMR